jgi:hypothetical protein
MKPASTSPIQPSDKLHWLRRLDRDRPWRFLDDRCSCRVCGETFTGRQIRLVGGTRPHGPLRLECPTPSCFSTPDDWTHSFYARERSSQRFLSPFANGLSLKHRPRIPMLFQNPFYGIGAVLKLRLSVFKNSLHVVHHVGVVL